MKIGDVVQDISDGKLKTVVGIGRDLVKVIWFERTILKIAYQFFPELNLHEITVMVPKELHERLAESGIALAWKAKFNF